MQKYRFPSGREGYLASEVEEEMVRKEESIKALVRILKEIHILANDSDNLSCYQDIGEVARLSLGALEKTELA